jgi:large subunit ribosomal protein L25
MKTFEIKVSKRDDLGKKATKKLRDENNIVCVLYGGKENIHFYAHENEFKDVIYTPHVYIVSIDVDGEKHNAVLQDIQFHPVTDKVLHVDFVEVFDDKPVTIGVPVEIYGNSVGIRNGGKLRFNKRYLKVSGLSKDLPDELKVDITNINIGDTIKVKDLSFDNITLLDPPSSLVAGVMTSRIAAKGLVEGAEEEEGAETAEGGEEASSES